MLRPLALAAALSVIGAGCAPADEAPPFQPAPAGPATAEATSPAPPLVPPAVAADVSATVARAAMEPVEDEPVAGGPASGTVTFTATDRGVLISADLSGLPADGLRALHVRVGGSCADPGPLFNPDGAPLGSPLRTRGRRPAGALGNTRARHDGTARYEHVEPLISLAAREGDDASVLGRALVLHARQDDFHTPPDGDPGPAVACGIIRPL